MSSNDAMVTAVLKAIDRKSENAELLAENRALRRMMDDIRDRARRQNPDGCTILDFMVVWNEQYEAKIAELKHDLREARRIILEVKATVQ